MISLFNKTFEMLSVSEAQGKIKSFAKFFGTEEVEINFSMGRVLAEDVCADRNYPPFNRSAMDGFALRSEDVGKVRRFKLTGELFAGASPDIKVAKGCCVKIMTGAALPKDTDAVIRVEDSKYENGWVEFTVSEIKPWANIAREGEDCRTGDRLVQKNELITASVLSVLAVTGKERILVYKLPTVALISTGDEVKPIDAAVLPYQIRDSNSYALAGFLKHYQIPVAYKALVPDNKELIRAAIQKGLSNDILILSGGVSMGDADFVPEILQQAGVEKVFHKVSIKPGKPLWFGIVGEGKAVFALPGNPMSVQVAFKLFIEPFLRKCFGLDELTELMFPLQELRKKRTKFDEYFPCRIINKNASCLEQISINGSGDISSTIHSDGLALHPSGTGDLQPGTVVRFIPWKSTYA